MPKHFQNFVLIGEYTLIELCSNSDLSSADGHLSIEMNVELKAV
jgi:hypothetical protein